MFGKQYPATIGAVTLYETRVRKEQRSAISLLVRFDFTHSLAEAIGGDAPMVQEALANGSARPARLSTPGIQLDTKHVRAMLNAGGDDKAAVSDTISLTAKAHRPSSSGGLYPSLVARLIFLIGEDVDGADRFFAFCRRNLGKTIKVRMDRKQLALPLEEEEEETEDDSEPVEEPMQEELL